jgi:hypothetical protein
MEKKFVRRIMFLFVLGFWAVMCLTATAGAADEPKKKGSNPAATAGASNKPQPQQYQIELEKAMASFFNYVQSLDQEKALTKEEKEKKAIEFVNKFRFGSEKKDFIFLATLKGNLVMDPYQPQLNGQSLLTWEDPNGQQVFKLMIDMLKANPEGYMSYLWPKYGGEKPVPTIAFLRSYQPFGWFVGAAMPIDTIEGFRPPAYGGAFVSLITVDIDNTRATGTAGNE